VRLPSQYGVQRCPLHLHGAGTYKSTVLTLLGGTSFWIMCNVILNMTTGAMMMMMMMMTTTMMMMMISPIFGTTILTLVVISQLRLVLTKSLFRSDFRTKIV
jgi:hypothetical protein